MTTREEYNTCAHSIADRLDELCDELAALSADVAKDRTAYPESPAPAFVAIARAMVKVEQAIAQTITAAAVLKDPEADHA